MATEQTSLFADEERIRESITDLYTSVCYQEVKPSNLQEERVKGLQVDIKKAEEKNIKLTKTFSDKIKAIQEKLPIPKSKVDINKNN